ncbi:MAG: oligoribonuclease [Acidobacteriota bacterium]
MGKAGKLIWIDLEMTGLDPDRERIIEIAALATDSELNILEEGPDVVIHQPDDLLDRMDRWNRKHHGNSGLTERVRRSSVSEDEAEQLTLHFVSSHCRKQKAPLAGNSVHHDRRFLSRYMPGLESYLHYRNVDVSTLKELVRRWYPQEFRQAPPKSKSHRAMDDIRESIEELRYYRRKVFR